jgi:hypothetical protein
VCDIVEEVALVDYIKEMQRIGQIFNTNLNKIILKRL